MKNKKKHNENIVTTSKGVIIEDRSVGNSVQIFINEVPHLCHKQSECRRLDAWKMGRKAKRFRAELYMVYYNEDGGDPISEIRLLEYDDAEISNIVLNMLAKYL